MRLFLSSLQHKKKDLYLSWSHQQSKVPALGSKQEFIAKFLPNCLSTTDSEVQPRLFRLSSAWSAASGGNLCIKRLLTLDGRWWVLSPVLFIGFWFSVRIPQGHIPLRNYLFGNPTFCAAYFGDLTKYFNQLMFRDANIFMSSRFV